jgi:hypothetical protein
MIILNYILYISHSFLLKLKKINSTDIEGRAKNAVTIIVFLMCMLIFSILYATGISLGVISYNKMIIFGISILLFLVIAYIVSINYKNNYYDIINVFENRFHYNQKTITFYFLLLWFVPFFLLWFSIIFIKKIIC